MPTLDPASACIAGLSRWLKQVAWPLWLARGIDHARGGFYESLDLDGYCCTADFRRLRVAARQIFVFAAAHRHGVDGAAAAVRVGLDCLARHAAHPQGGYASRWDLDHRITDPTRDCYDNAFVLLALAESASIAGVPAARRQTLDLLGWIDRGLAHPLGGYQESLPPALPRRQNPHMHLLEALLAAHAAFGDEVFLDRARSIVALFRQRLIDPDTGALPEFFDDALHPIRDAGRFLVEPGHHCEWIWLLHRYQLLAGPDMALQTIAARLAGFADRHAGHAAHGGMVDVLASDGSQVAATERLWPQTEWLRAELIRPDAQSATIVEAAQTLAQFLRPDGLWHERRAADATFSREPAPASSLYHLTGAILAAEAWAATR